jgi:D-alanyl-lipoteichoic acid acyltransferase DltB (MBOAT superfamily)
MTAAAATVALTSWLVLRLIFEGPGRDHWLLNHLLLVVGFVVVMTAFGQVNLGLWRLLGVRARPVMDHIWLARTPADFWRRWSWPIHLWLYQYVYIPCGGRRRAFWALLAVFAFSGLLHELIAFVASGRITGHQSAFFGLSAAGALASPLLERIGRRGLVGEALIRLVTLLFLVASSALMFVTVDAVLPLYATRWWLMW